MRILVADDNLATRRLLEVTLQGLGHEVVTAADGFEAWQLLQQPEAPPVVLLDWVMPGVDGLGLLQMLRQDPYRPGPYVIMLSARGRQADLLEALEAGADDYMVKPLEPRVLQARLLVAERLIARCAAYCARLRELEDGTPEADHAQGEAA